MRSLGEVTKAGPTVHLIGLSVYDVPGRRPFLTAKSFDLQKKRKNEEETAIAEDKTDVFIGTCGSIRGCLVSHLIPVAGIEILKRPVLLRQIAKDLGEDSPLFEYYEPK